MWSLVAVVVHVLIVFWLVGGIVARDIAYGLAARESNLDALRTFVRFGGHAERHFVRPATFAVLVAGLIAAWARGWPILGALQGAHVNWVLTALVIYLSIIPVIVLVFLPRGRVFRVAFDAAIAEGRVTPALTAALNDPAVRLARGYELLMIATLTVLMVMRPF